MVLESTFHNQKNIITTKQLAKMENNRIKALEEHGKKVNEQIQHLHNKL